MAEDIEVYREHIILRAVIGSRAYGLARPDSDWDRRGVYLPPAVRHWSLSSVPEQLECEATQECYWEIQKFLRLGLKGNPTVLEALWSPIIEHATPLGEELISMREAFLSKEVHRSFSSYALSQWKKMGQDVRTRGVVRWKHAMHLVRLLLSGIKTLREGAMLMDVGPLAPRLHAIRNGEVPWDEVDAWRQQLEAELDDALARTHLPDRPDRERVEAFLLRARRSVV
jgi:uncharacterized protein